MKDTMEPRSESAPVCEEGWEIYDEAEYYALAFSQRSWETECDFLASQVAADARSFLEICAGPAEHCRRFARRGWRAVAVDRNPRMRDHALRAARSDGVKLDYHLADIRDFTLERPADLAFCAIESFTHLLTNDDVIRHFRAISAALRPDGAYVVEFSHPRHFCWCACPKPNRWTVKNGDLEVECLYGMPGDDYDNVAQVWRLSNELTARRGGKVVFSRRGKSENRFYLCQELRALAEAAGGFADCAFFGSFALPAMPLAPDSPQMIAVFRRR